MALILEERKQIVAGSQHHAKDTGSAEVQISLLTGEVNALAEHLKDHDKDNHSRRGLVMKVARRNRLLKYLARTNPAGYQKLIAKLGLRK
jgi:small subunit ribosomal protein S15